MTDSGSGINGFCDTNALLATGAGAFSSLEVHAETDNVPSIAAQNTVHVVNGRLEPGAMSGANFDAMM
jgi:hypothetical protein